VDLCGVTSLNFLLTNKKYHPSYIDRHIHYHFISINF